MKRAMLVLTLLSAPLLGDEIYLKGGGQLSGQIVEQTAETVTIDIGGGTLRCAPASGSCDCTPELSGNQRTCARENARGRCLGVEICQDDAWSECSAATPARPTGSPASC